MRVDQEGFTQALQELSRRSDRTLSASEQLLRKFTGVVVIVPNAIRSRFARTPWWSLRAVGVYEYCGNFGCFRNQVLVAAA